MLGNTVGAFRKCALVAALVLAVPVAAWAAAALSADEAALKAYVLNLDKVNHYLTATEALNRTKSTNRAIAGELDAMDNEPQTSLIELKAKLNRHPRVFAFYQKEGLTVDDAAMIPMALFNAGIAATVNNPAISNLVSPGQLAFVRQHPEVNQRLQKASEEAEDKDGH